MALTLKDNAKPAKQTVMTAEGRFEALNSQMSPYYRRAQDAAKLTIPGLMPPQGHNGATNLPTPYQAVGARGVNNLASKLLLALLPPGSSFFRLMLTEKILDMIEREGNPEDIKGKFEATLGKMETRVMAKLEEVGARTAIFELLKQLIVSGNCLLQILDTGKFRTHIFPWFVVKRDPSGNVLEVITKEPISEIALSAPALAIVEKEENEKQSRGEKRKDGQASEETYSLFTRVVLVDNTYVAHQEICGQVIPGSEGTYPKNRCPWIPLRFARVDGEDYGRGYVEEYIGDLISLDSLSQSVIEFAAIAAKVIYFVDEAGQTLKKKVADAPNGAVIDGSAKDVSVLQLEKNQDFQAAKATMDAIEGRIVQAFLINQVRDAERVTAEEIRLIAMELEKALGGVYSVLTQELQLPLVNIYMAQMERKGELPRLPKGAVVPQIVTGLDALGRSSDMEKLDALIQGLETVVGPQGLGQWLNISAFIQRRATALQMDATGLVKTQQEVDAANQQAQMNDSVNKLGPHIIKGVADASKAAAQAPAQG